jgi:hypothetical protein
LSSAQGLSAEPELLHRASDSSLDITTPLAEGLSDELGSPAAASAKR